MTVLRVTTAIDETYDGGDLAAETADGGGLSLREALGIVHLDPRAVSRIEFADDAGEAFETGGKIVLEHGSLDLRFGGGVTIDAEGASRIFDIAGDAALVQLSGLTLEDGAAATGGAILSIDALTVLEDVALIGNEATGGPGGAVALAGGEMILSRVEAADNRSAGAGGAIWAGVSATLGMEFSLFSGNSAGGDGGAIASQGKLLTLQSTFADNAAGGDGGALHATGLSTVHASGFLRNAAEIGGGLHLAGTAELFAVTAAQNEAGTGGGIHAAGAATLINVTAAGNLGETGSGLSVGNGTVTVENSLIAGNETDDAFEIALVGTSGATLSFLGANLIGESPLLDGVGGFSSSEHTRNLTTGFFPDIDGPILEAVFETLDETGLAVAGTGPEGLVSVALALDLLNPALASPLFGPQPFHADYDAIPKDIFDDDGDADEPTSPAGNGVEFDQTVEIGAFQFGAPSLLVTTALDVVDAHDGLTSLREAVLALNAGLAEGPIVFDDGFLGGATILLEETLHLAALHGVYIDGDVDGDGVADVTLDAQGLGRAVHVDGGALLTGVNVTGGFADVGAGIFVEFGGLIFRNGAIYENSATVAGGGIAALERIDVTGAEIRNNLAMDGGGVALLGAQGEFTRVSITGNGALGDGGGIWLGGIWLGGSEFTTEHGVYGGLPVVTVVNSTIGRNFALGSGGGIGATAFEAGISLINATVTGNNATLGGAAIDATGGRGFLGVDASIIAGNGGDPSTAILLSAANDRIDGFGFVTEGGGVILDAPAMVAGTGEEVLPVGDFLLEEGAGAGPIIVLSLEPDLDIADVFAEIDAETGGGLLADNGGVGLTAALNPGFSNPALDIPGALLGEDLQDEFPDPEGYGTAQNGVDRVIDASTGETGTGAADMGAHELAFAVLTGEALTGTGPEGGPVIADFASGDGDLTISADEINGSSFLNLGIGDRLVLTGEVDFAALVRSGDLYGFDDDGDGLIERGIRVTVEDGYEASFRETAEGLEITAATTGILGEVMQIDLTTAWQTLSFANTYRNPVVFALSPTTNEDSAVATRLRDITGDSAEILMQETKFLLGERRLDRSHATEQVTVVVLEAGVHTLADGSTIEVGTIDTNLLPHRGFEQLSFEGEFDAAPAVFSQVQTTNGFDWVIARQNNVGTDGFELTMQEEEADNFAHGVETVGWLAAEKGYSMLGDMVWQAGSSFENVNGAPTKVKFDVFFEAAPLVMGSLASYTGADPAGPRVDDVANWGFYATAKEDQSRDAETFHNRERIDWIAFEHAGTLVSEVAAIPEVQGRRIIESGTVEVDDGGISVEFLSQFENPVVFALVNTFNQGHEVVARVIDVDADGFDLILQEPDGLDGAHGPETVSWIAVEAGTWAIGDLALQAGAYETDAAFRGDRDQFLLDDRLGEGAAAFAQTQSAMAPDFVQTRLSLDGFSLSLGLETEEADMVGSHGAERVGWLALSAGAATDAGGETMLASGFGAANNFSNAFRFGEVDFGGAPALIAGLTGARDLDPAGVRSWNLSGDGFSLKVQEDRSADAEVGHIYEEFAWLAVGDEEVFGTALI